MTADYYSYWIISLFWCCYTVDNLTYDYVTIITILVIVGLRIRVSGSWDHDAPDVNYKLQLF
jgi:hypothetical protein